MHKHEHDDPRARARTRIENGVTVTSLPGLLNIPTLRDHQRRAIEAASAGGDVLVIVATGGGKTEGFVGAGLLLGGVTLIVSPLRSLMTDQRRRLEAIGLPVRIWNSDIKDAEKQDTLALLDSGWSGFVVATPESLKGRDLSLTLKGRVRLAVVDEAHCVLKERGFRVNYSWLGKTLDRIGPTVRYACTATLPAEDHQHLIASLHLRDPEVIVLPVARSNLAIHIAERNTWALVEILNRHHRQPGIVFAATIRTAQKIHGDLLSQGRNVGLYHGQLAAKAKKASQAAFMSGDVPVMITTDAFLLGIDKADLRFIAHYDPPKSIEDWVQGFGRAGRDGLPADVYGCFRSARDGKASREFLIRCTFPEVSALRRVWRYLSSAPYRDETAARIGETANGPAGKYSGQSSLTQLQRHHLADATVNPQDRRRRLYRARGDFDATDWSAYEQERAQALARFGQLCELAALPETAIPEAIDRYFGDVERRIQISAHGDYPAAWDEVA